MAQPDSHLSLVAPGSNYPAEEQEPEPFYKETFITLFGQERYDQDHQK